MSCLLILIGAEPRLVGGGETNFAAWATLYQLPPGENGPADTPSHDGIPNLLKYAMGLDPWGVATESLIAPAVSGQGDQKRAGIGFPRAKYATGIQWILESSGDLKSWQTAAGTLQKMADLNAQREWVHLVDNRTMDQVAARFYRLQLLGNGMPADSKLVLGEPQELLTAQIGWAGGAWTVHQPGDPLDGLQILVPANTFAQPCSLKISSVPIQSHAYAEAVHPITPLIRVDHGNQFPTNVITIQIPILLPTNHFALAFSHDPANGELEGMPLAGLTTSSLSLATYQVSEFFVSSIAETNLPSEVATGFLPGVDDWAFANHTSYWAPRGQGSGQSLSALWYYGEKRLKEGVPALTHHRDDPGSSPPMMNPELDDVRGRQLCARVEVDHQFKAAADAFWRGAGVTPLQTLKAFRYALQVTQRPHLARLLHPTGGLDCLVYRADDHRLHVADPNYPGDRYRYISFQPATGKFDPFYSGFEAEDVGVTFAPIVFQGRYACIDTAQMTQRWQQWASGTIAQGAFPDYSVEVVDADFKTIGEFTSTNESSPVLEVASRSVFVLGKGVAQGIQVYDRQGRWLPLDDQGLPVYEGTNTIGLEVYAEVSTPGATNQYVWAGFNWVTLVKGSSMPTNFDYTSLIERHSYGLSEEDFSTSDYCVYYVDKNYLKQGVCRGYADDRETLVTLQGFFLDGRMEGAWYVYWTNGVLSNILTYHQGRKDGPYTDYYPSGVKWSEGWYRPDPDDPKYTVRHGVYTEYWENGKVKQSGTYFNEVMVGPWSRYYQSGGRQQEFTLDENGKMFGVNKWYYENGVLYEEKRYDAQGLQGIYKRWYPDGTRQHEWSYVNGKADGRWVAYYPNGNTALESYYKNDVKTGLWTYYTETGGVLRTEQYP